MPEKKLVDGEIAEGEVAQNSANDTTNGDSDPTVNLSENKANTEYDEMVKEKLQRISQIESNLKEVSSELNALNEQSVSTDRFLKKLEKKTKELDSWKDEKTKEDKNYEDLNGKDSLFTRSILKGMFIVGLLAGAIGALLGGPFIMFFLAYGLSAGLTYAVARPFITNLRNYFKKRQAQNISESKEFKLAKAFPAKFNAQNEKLQRDYEGFQKELNSEKSSLDSMKTAKIFADEKKYESAQAIKNGKEVLSAVSPLKTPDYSKMSDENLQTTYHTVQDTMKQSFNAKDDLEIVDSPVKYSTDNKLQLPAKVDEDEVIDVVSTQTQETKSQRELNDEATLAEVKEFYNNIPDNKEDAEEVKNADVSANTVENSEEESDFSKTQENLGKDLNKDVVTTPQAVSTAPVVEEESDELKHK